jgi:predicted phosphodiesterase
MKHRRLTAEVKSMCMRVIQVSLISGGSMRTLVIGDLHCPATHPKYLDFVKKIRDKYKTNNTVFIGDVVDHASISFHKKNPEHPAAMDEYHQAMKGIAKWSRAFPEATVTIGNHDERVARLAADSGIPCHYLKGYAEIYNTPQWDWVRSVDFDGVHFYHGVGAASQYPAFNAAKMKLQSVVIGHYHSVASINWICGPNMRLFGMSVGSGVDRDHPLMLYGSAWLKKPIVSCGVVIDGMPYLELMDL